MKDSGTAAQTLELDLYYMVLLYSGLVNSKKGMADKMGYQYIYLTNVFSGKFPLVDKFVEKMEETFPVPFRDRAAEQLLRAMQSRIIKANRHRTSQLKSQSKQTAEKSLPSQGAD